MHTPGSRFCFCRVGLVEEIEHHLIIGRGAHIIAYRHMIRIIKIVLQRRLIGKGLVDAEIECFLALMQVYADGAAENFRKDLLQVIHHLAEPADHALLLLRRSLQLPANNMSQHRFHSSCSAHCRAVFLLILS